MHKLSSRMSLRLSCCCLAASLLAAAAAGQTITDGTAPLHDEILEMDRILFDAFNSCDIQTMASVFADDLEFFHDTGGLSGHESTMKVTFENCQRNLGLVRTLDVDTVAVYPIKGYGAIQEGRHTFCHLEDGETDCGTFRFLHIWRQSGPQWQLSRVVSYGH